MPTISDTTLDLSTITKEVGKIHEVFNKGLAKVNSPRALLTLGHHINPVELAGGESTHTEALLEDGDSPPLDSLDSPDSPLPHL